MGRLKAAPPRLAAADTGALKAAPYETMRGSARERGYTYRWEQASKAFIAANPLCLGCKAAGVVTATALTDHIVPHRGKRRLFWTQNNWQPSCAFHHNAVKQALERRWHDGELTDQDLQLDSPAAIELTARIRAKTRKGRGG